jgi:hypothetical protein
MTYRSATAWRNASKSSGKAMPPAAKLAGGPGAATWVLAQTPRGWRGSASKAASPAQPQLRGRGEGAFPGPVIDRCE